MDKEELIEKERILKELELLINEINDFKDKLNISEIENISVLVHNKINLMAIAFYKERMDFYNSYIINFIYKYFLNLIRKGVILLGEYSKCNYTCLSNVFLDRYYDLLDIIKKFNLYENVIDAIKSAIPNIRENGVGDNAIDMLIHKANLELSELGIITVLPTVSELDDNGKNLHK